jgi:hypothetical protein
MKRVFLLLALANILFFAARYYTQNVIGRNASPLVQQIQPEKIRLLSPTEVQRLALTRSGIACVELGPVAMLEAKRAEGEIARIAGTLKVTQRRAEEPARWWVYLAPPTRQAAAQREAELKKRGVEEASVITDDPGFRNAISLGIFSTEEAANDRAAELRKLGVSDVRITPRPGVTYLQLRDAPEAVRARLLELKGRFAGAEVKECPS